MYCIYYNTQLFLWKTEPNEPSQQNRARASPTGTGCLIGKVLISLAPHKRRPASSRSPWSTKTSQMDVIYPATPKIYNFSPKIPPTHPTASTTTRLPHLALFMSIYWRPRPLPNSPARLYSPALPSGTHGRATTLPARPRIILVS